MNQITPHKVIFLAVSLIILCANSVSANNKRDIRSVDFRNFAYDSKQSIDKIVLRNGSRIREELPRLYAKDNLVSVRYVDFDGDGQDEAVVRIRSTTSGSMGYAEEYYVFAYRNGEANKIFHEWRERPKRMRIEGNSIVLVAPLWTEADAHCCPRYVETVRYRWRGSRFVASGRRQKLHYRRHAA